MKRKIGQMATPKDFPILQGKISEISTFMGEETFVLESGGRYTESELEPKA